MSKGEITRWNFNVSALLIASHCGERLCLVFRGVKLPFGRLRGKV